MSTRDDRPKWLKIISLLFRILTALTAIAFLAFTLKTMDSGIFNYIAFAFSIIGDANEICYRTIIIIRPWLIPRLLIVLSDFMALVWIAVFLLESNWRLPDQKLPDANSIYYSPSPSQGHGGLRDSSNVIQIRTADIGLASAFLGLHIVLLFMNCLECMPCGTTARPAPSSPTNEMEESTEPANQAVPVAVSAASEYAAPPQSADDHLERQRQEDEILPA